MPTNWRAAAALREQSPAKIPELCAGAREKIYKRILQQSQSSRSQEREELDHALRQLVIHELKKTTLALSPQPDPARSSQLTER